MNPGYFQIYKYWIPRSQDSRLKLTGCNHLVGVCKLLMVLKFPHISVPYIASTMEITVEGTLIESDPVSQCIVVFFSGWFRLQPCWNLILLVRFHDETVFQPNI